MSRIAYASSLRISGARSGWERRPILYACAVLLAAAAPSLVRGFDAPLQVDATATLRTVPRGGARLVAAIPGGPARVAATIQGLPGGRTVRVDLVFDYPEAPPGEFFAFTELIDGIELTTERPGGEIIHKVSIDAGLAALNPGAGRLFYRATLPILSGGETIVARVRVFGNYE